MAPRTRRQRTNRAKVLCLGVSHASIQDQFVARAAYRGEPLAPLSSREPLAQVLECVRRGILNQMDGRDLARCVATEQTCHVDVYTVSQEHGAAYRADRHVEANFNRSVSVIKALEKLGVIFDQVILDYFWIPAGWNQHHWAQSFFATTLPMLRQRQLLHSGSQVYLPFCLHCFQQVLACRNRLLEHYDIGFVRKPQLASLALWKGTQAIDPHVMQTLLGKRLDQEEVYCSFGPRDVNEAEDDPSLPKSLLIDFCRRLEDFADIRFLVLTPVAGKKGVIQGLGKLRDIQRGFDQMVTSSADTPAAYVPKVRRQLFPAAKATAPPKALKRVVTPINKRLSPSYLHHRHTIKHRYPLRSSHRLDRSRSPTSVAIQHPETLESSPRKRLDFARY